MKKRVLSVLLAVALVIGMAVPAFAATVPISYLSHYRFLTCVDSATGAYQLDLTRFINESQEGAIDEWLLIKQDMLNPDKTVFFDFRDLSGTGIIGIYIVSVDKADFPTYKGDTQHFGYVYGVYGTNMHVVYFHSASYTIQKPPKGFDESKQMYFYMVGTDYAKYYPFTYIHNGDSPFTGTYPMTGDFIKSLTVVDSFGLPSHTLTVNYQYEDGSEAALSTTQTVEEGAAYSVVSPTVEGYTPNKPTVSGTMGTEDITETVVYSKTAHTLTINYQYADGGQAAPPATRSLADGDTYAVASPTIEGYTPDRAVVAGFMGAADKTETVTYNKNSHTLTVNYQYEDGTKASDPVTQTVEYGASYSVPSPSITGYKPDRATVAGTMPDQDVTATVTYIGQSSNLTIVYQYEDGSQAAPTYTAELAEGSTYEVRSPDIKGYTPNKEFVSGTVPEGGVTVTVTYKAVKHTLTVNYQYEDGSPAADTVTQSLVSGERYEIASPVIDGYKPSTATVTGFMPSRDKTILVTYAKDSSSSGGSTPPPKPGGDWEYHDPWAGPSADFFNQLFGGYTFQGPFFSGSGGGSGGKRYPWDGLDQDALIGELLGDYEYHSPYPGGG